MSEGLALFVRDWGSGSLVALFVVMIFTGWLVPKRRHDREISLIEASKNEALAREEHYRLAVDKQNEVIRLQAAQMKDLMEHAETTVALLEAIESRAKGDFGGTPARKSHPPAVRGQR